METLNEVYLLRSNGQFWTGLEWSSARGAAKRFASWDDAEDARVYLDSDRDIGIVRVVWVSGENVNASDGEGGRA